MSILNITTDYAGLVGVVPRVIYLETNDNLSTITTAGYLNKAVSQGYTFSEQDVALVYGTDLVSGNPGTNFFQVSVSGSAQPYTYSLVQIPGYVAANSITAADIVQISANRLMGNPSGASANFSEIALGNGLGFASSTLSVNTSLGVYATGSITSAQFKAAYATPLQLLAAPGANTMFLVKNFALEAIYGTAAYTSGGALGLQYGNTAHLAGAAASATIAAATINGIAANSVVGALGSLPVATAAATVNAGLFLSNDTAAFATGDGTFKYHLWYSVVSTTV